MSQYGGQDVHYFREVKSVDDLRIENGNPTLDGFNQRFTDWTKAKNAAFEGMKRRIDMEYQRTLESAKSISKKPIIPKSRPEPEKKEYPLLSESELKQYGVGMRVHHRNFGNGEIVSIDYATQRVEIRYDKKVNFTRKHSLATLIGAGTLKKL
ncbi:MAG: hypothetical protein NC299_13155 [Lachnospiraceae bacterium]|nr:hypothetical protein [Ruminococcus sp.]MCM1276284.1 hypothetical protein [Lachnospiraceae bacterium]